MGKTVYYDSFQDDFVQSRNQDYKLGDSCEYRLRGGVCQGISDLVYELTVGTLVLLNRLFWHIRIENRSCLKACRNSRFIVYVNHTQPIRDVYMPSMAFRWRRLYVFGGEANYGIPIIGRLLPFLGAIPVTPGKEGLERLRRAVHWHTGKGRGIVIYPEAHVWPYYTRIRPFSSASFQFAVWEQVPVFCMTVTYQKRRRRKKPGITLWLDGPFTSDRPGERAKRKDLHRQVMDCMTRQSKKSNCEYIHYEQRRG